MRHPMWQSLFAVAILLTLLPAASRAGGVGISSPAETATETTDTLGIFYPRRVGPSNSFRRRDLEFQWDSLYSGARSYLGFSTADLNLLDTLGTSIADVPFNPFGGQTPDLWLVHDYFNDHGTLYDSNPNFPHGFFIGSPTEPDSDRSHVDVYLYRPGHAGMSVGQTPSAFATAKEDSSTGHWGIYGLRDTVFHDNSIMVPGPPQSAVSGSAWTHADHGPNGVFNHEFQHSMDTRFNGLWTEVFSSGAEAVAGHGPTDAIINDVPYTWPLIADNAGPTRCASCTELRCIGQNYQAWRLFSAYLAYNFRGRDTTAALPSGSVVGFADDLLYKFAHAAVGSLEPLIPLLSDQSCFSCSTSTYFHPGGAALGNGTRLGLLLHNWRVATFVNNSSLAEGQYGFPPQFGFKPALDVGAWQSLDGCGAQDDIVAIPPEVTMSNAQVTVELTKVGTRDHANGLYTYPMALQPLGSEYWVIRSDTALAQGQRDLVVRVSPEGIHRVRTRTVSEDPNCLSLDPAQADARLFASVIGYSGEGVSGQPDSLWKHPEWAALPLTPQWVDVDSTAKELEFVLPEFGSTYKAALVVLSLGDGPTGHYATQTSQLESYIEALPYGVTAALRVAPYQSQNPLPVSAQSDVNDDFATWSPAGDEVMYHSSSGSPPSQIYRRRLDGSAAAALIPQSHHQEAPDWSPRGDWVAFDQDSATAQYDIWLYNTQTQASPTRLTFQHGFSIIPSFQPNGQRLVYLHLVGNPMQMEIRRINLDGTNDVVLATLDSIPFQRVRWSPDGQWIYYARNEVLYALPAEGGAPIRRQAVIPRVAAFDFRTSDGRLAVEEPGESMARSICNPLSAPETTFVGLPFRRLAIRDTLTGDTQARFYRTGVKFFNPRWSPDGTRVAYSADDNVTGDRDLYVGQVSYNHAPRFSSPPRDTTLVLPCPPYTFAFDLSASDPDGESVTYQAAYLPPGASLSANHFSWPNPGPSGTDYYVVFRALDGSGGLDSKVVKLALAADPARPAKASDVTVATGRYGATVTWTATGDDSLTGTACRFDLRRSTSTITEANFGSLTDTVAVPTPGEAGTVHCVEVHSLSSCTWYYFALKTKDDAGHWSALSNVGSGKTTCSGNQDVFCEGEMMAQGGGGGGGWSGEDALLELAPLGEYGADAIQLRSPLAPEDGHYRLRLVNTGDPAFGLDEVTLATVDHAANTSAFLAGRHAVVGTALPAYRVTGSDEANLTSALDGSADHAYIAAAGEALTVQLREDEAAATALMLETAAGGSAGDPDSSGILVQVPDGKAGWTTLARHVPRKRWSRFVVDSLDAATVRLVFLDPQQVRFIGRIDKAAAVTPEPLALANAKHSDQSDVSAAAAVAGGSSAALGAGEAITLEFVASALAEGQARDFIVNVRGTRAVSKAALAARATPRREELPLSFALHPNQPNPFAAATTFRFDLPSAVAVRLEVFDLSGRRVAVVRDASFPAGRHAVTWQSRGTDRAPIRPGVYAYRLTAGAFRAQRKLVVLP